MVITRRAALSLGAAAFAQGDPRLWVPARRKYGAPVTHVVAGDTAGVRTLRNVRWPDASHSNAAAVQWQRYRLPGVPVWVAPPKPDGASVEDCLVALADCEASGARWVIDCDEAAFPRVAEAIRFFDAHRDWRSFVDPRQIGVMANAAPALRPVMEQVMNQMCRAALPYRLVTGPMPGMSVLVVFGAPDAAAHDFANKGGMVISLGWKAMADRSSSDPAWVITRHPRTGGWMCAWRGAVTNAAQFVTDLKARLGEDRAVVKLGHAPSTLVRVTVAEAEGRVLAQLVDYSGRRSESASTVWVQFLAATAVLHQWGAAPLELEVRRMEGGSLVTVPPRGVYAAVEWTLL